MSVERTADAALAAHDVPQLTPSQRRIVELLKRNGAATIMRLAAGVALNVETVRHHVRRLESAGHVARRGTRSVGPGRPEVVYGLTAMAERLFPRREGDVLRALAAHLHESGRESVLREFFTAYIGARLEASLPRVAGLEGEARVAEVARIMAELGFMASVESSRGGARLHLCHCPLRELVEVSRVPCTAELDFIRSLLGGELTRLAHIPSGDASCSYRVRSA